MIDLESLRVVRSQASGDDPEVIRVDPNRPYIYVSNEDDNIVSVLEADGRSLVIEIPVGVEPEGLDFRSNGRWRAYNTETHTAAHCTDASTMEASHPHSL